jgi:hypothetical protein
MENGKSTNPKSNSLNHQQNQKASSQGNHIEKTEDIKEQCDKWNGSYHYWIIKNY